MAIGIVASGFALGGLLVPVITYLIDVLQWRMAMLTVGLGTLVIVLPLSLLVRHKPEQYGYEPDGAVNSAVEARKTLLLSAGEEVNITAQQAIRNGIFWRVAVASMLHSFVVGAVVMHIMPYLSSLGITRTLSSIAALVLPMVSICGRLGSGWLSDRLGKRRVFAASFALISVGLFLFAHITPETMWLLIPFLITFSIGWGGSVTTRVILIREYFGRLSFGTILGFTSGVMMVGNIAGAPLAGWVFDTWGNYQGAWLGYSAVAIAGMVLVLTIPPSSTTIPLSDRPRTQEATK